MHNKRSFMASTSHELSRCSLRKARADKLVGAEKTGIHRFRVEEMKQGAIFRAVVHLVRPGRGFETKWSTSTKRFSLGRHLVHVIRNSPPASDVVAPRAISWGVTRP
jgi:hypothetical protein